MKPCLEAGCPHMALSGKARCAAHQKALEARRNAKPERAVYRDPAYRSMVLTGPCWICGQDIPPGEMTKDHVVPISAGGTNDPDNIQPAHRRCNSARGNRT